jgi:hypothetical protein
VIWAKKVTVITPSEGRLVAVPFKVLPVNRAVALAAGLTEVTVPGSKPVGNASWNVALLAVLGPALLITKVKVIALPATVLVLPPTTALAMLRSAVGVTFKMAVAVALLLPTEVVSEPAGIVLVPVKMPVTTTETEQLAPGGITVPPKTASDEPAGAAVTPELAQVVVANGEDELLMPSG